MEPVIPGSARGCPEDFDVFGPGRGSGDANYVEAKGVIMEYLSVPCCLDDDCCINKTVSTSTNCCC